MSDERSSVHPEALLAAYVDGTAGSRERATVAAHLERCDRCRDEVAAASRGLRAAKSLGMLDAPGVTGSVLEALGAEPSAPRRIVGWRRRRVAGHPRTRRGHWSPVATRVLAGSGVVGLAAAAIALFVVGVGGSGTPTTGSAPLAAASAPNPARSPVLITRGTTYTTDALKTLTDRLAAQYAHSSRSALAQLARPVPTPVPSAAFAGPSFSGLTSPNEAAVKATQCLMAGGAPALSPIYLEFATVDGTPAFVAAYLETAGAGTPTRLALFAVARSGCQPLFFTSKEV
jgi:hypothetical protein